MAKSKIEKRPAVGIVIDYTMRIPDFVKSYSEMRQQISIGNHQLSGASLDREDLFETKKSLWDDLREKDPKAAEWYETTPMPTDHTAKDFDITYRKYFYTPEHRTQFLVDWSYNLYGQGSITNKVDVNLINVAQTKLFDVILIDRTTHARKTGNTFAYLGRTGAFVKEVRFISSEEEIESLKKEDHILDIWNPFTNPEQIILPGKFGEPTKAFLEWLQLQEQRTKKI